MESIYIIAILIISFLIILKLFSTLNKSHKTIEESVETSFSTDENKISYEKPNESNLSNEENNVISEIIIQPEATKNSWLYPADDFGATEIEVKQNTTSYENYKNKKNKKKIISIKPNKK